jgi:hypothetical protein
MKQIGSIAGPNSHQSENRIRIRIKVKRWKPEKVNLEHWVGGSKSVKKVNGRIWFRICMKLKDMILIRIHIRVKGGSGSK